MIRAARTAGSNPRLPAATRVQGRARPRRDAWTRPRLAASRGPRGTLRELLAALRTPRGMRRVLLVAVLVAVVLVPAPLLAAGGQQRQPACHGCHAQPATTQRWAAPLSGVWAAGNGAGGTVPAVGQAYVSVGGGLVALGDGLTLSGFALADGSPLWQVTLSGPAGSSIISVRAWPGVVTAGVLTAGGRSRTEVVIDATTGMTLRRYPAAVFGGAVQASAATTVVVGRKAVTSYDNDTGRVRWRLAIGPHRSWRADGQTLYVAQAAGGFLGSSPVTALRVINMSSGNERTLASPLGNPFSGTLAIAADGAVLFASAAGVTAYSGSTGGELWSMAGAVPEGTDPTARLIYLTSASGALTGVDPTTGVVRTSVSGSTAGGGTSGMYVVRDGVALGLDGGGNGTAWGYDMATGQVSWTSPVLPWPHYFSDVSGLGGSASASGDTVVVTACPQLAASPPLCADPELVAFTL